MSHTALDIRILLHNIRSAHNVGAMFRTADAIGVHKCYLSGYTPTPLDRFQRPVKEIVKTALGAETSIVWEYCISPLEVIAMLKKEGFLIIGLEQDIHSCDYKNITPIEKVLLLVGSEVEGLDPLLRDVCDLLIEIPMYGTKESLNVATAFGISLFRLFDR